MSSRLIKISFALIVATGSLMVAPAGSAAAAGASVAWPQFHFNAAHTGYNPFETTIGPANVGGLHLLWKGGATGGVGSVSVSRGRAFLGGFQGVFRAWNASDGSLSWSRPLDDLLESTPAISAGRVFIESNAGTLYALDAASGSLLWTQPTGQGAVTSPTVVGDVVFAAGNESLNAFDTGTGALLWTTDLE